MPELRCESRLHGISVSPDVLEVKCSSRFCGARPGTVVLHRIDMKTGRLLATDTFRDLSKEGKKGASK